MQKLQVGLFLKVYSHGHNNGLADLSIWSPYPVKTQVIAAGMATDIFFHIQFYFSRLQTFCRCLNLIEHSGKQELNSGMKDILLSLAIISRAHLIT
jgi:hypothetical protein